MGVLQLRDKWILITGASSGLGKEMATQLARHYRANLIIVARRTAQLELLQTELETAYKVQVKVLTADLSKKEDVVRVYSFATREVDLSGAILNAGITYFGHDHRLTEENRDNIIQSMASLLQQFAKYFDESQKERGLLVVSSMAAISPTPYQSLYSGTKAFIYAYAQALSEELENRHFSISIFAPGGIRTEMTSNAGFDALQKWLMPVDKAARVALDGFVKRRLLTVPGFENRVGAFLFKFLPKKFLLGKLGHVYRKALANLESKV